MGGFIVLYWHRVYHRLPMVTTLEVSCRNSMTCSFTAMIVLHVVMLHWATLYKHVLETIIRRKPKPEYKLDKD